MQRSLLYLLVLILFACKTKQPVNLNLPILESVDKEQLSKLYIPIKLGKKDLENAINEKIGEVIFEDDNLNGDNISVRATRIDSITLSLKDTTLVYTVPLHILVKKSLRLLGDTEAEGSLVLEFATNYQLNEDWTVVTNTSLQQYDWVKTPKINVLGAKIPVKAIADRVLAASQDKITNQIDALVADGLAIKGYAEKVWNQIQEPILVSKEYNSSVKITPYGLAISPFRLQNDTIVSTLFVQGLSEISVGDQIDFTKNAPLPPLKLMDFETAPFQLRVLAQIPFEEAEQLALQNLKGETYEFRKNKITVQDLKLSKDGEKVAVELDVIGDYEGKLYLKGIPSYDKKNSQIDIKKVEFRLDTKNFLLKTAKWLFSDLIINKIEGNLQYSIDEDLQEIKQQIQKQLTNYEIQKGINVEGQVADLKVQQVGLADDAILAVVELTGDLEVVAKGF